MKWLKKLFQIKPLFGFGVSKHKIRPENVDHPDPVARQIIAEAFNTGKAMVGQRNPDGSVTITEIKDIKQ
jgi:hypothetical protein